MADHRDPEKEPHSVLANSTSTTSSSEPDKENHHHDSDEHSTPSSPTDSTATGHSRDSIDTDPLSPLEEALTPDLETPQERMSRPISRIRTATSIGTTGSRLPDFEVDFEPDQSDNPRHWPLWYRGCTLFAVSIATWVVVLYSTSYTSGMPGMMEEFHESSITITTLGVTTYLTGLAVGSLILAPMSEIYGRRPVYIVSIAIFCLMVLPCALATSLSEIIIVRFFGALFGAALISNAPGSVSDISNEEHRALAFSIWSIGPMNGPVTGPLIGGFVFQYLGWRWTNWVVLCICGASWIGVACISETYAPAILKRKAAKCRKETGDDRYWCRYDQKLSFRETLKINLSRPFILTATEPILWFWDLYISVIYGILYLCFVAYPIIFTDIRGWSPGLSGLGFAGIGIGTMITIICEPLIRRFINSHKKDPETGRVPPEAALSIVSVASILCPVGQLWFSWTSVPASIHWIWCLLAGIPFGAGNAIIFIYASNYVAGAYGIYAASALAGNAVIRSFFGGTLPLAGPKMYDTLTPQWAGTLLGLLEVILIPIPFVFWKWGSAIRKRSPLIRKMREDALRNERRAKKRAANAAAANGANADVEKQEEAGGISQGRVREKQEDINAAATTVTKGEDIAENELK